MKVVYFILLDDPRVLFAFPVQLFNLETENVLVCILGLKTTYLIHLSITTYTQWQSSIPDSENFYLTVNNIY